MRACPICKISDCHHEKKFYCFGLAKIIIIQKSIDATLAVFGLFISFIPLNTEMKNKINLTYDDFRKGQERVEEVRKWLEVKAK